MTQAAQGAPALSVVMIAFNEEACVEAVTRELVEALDASEAVPSFEIVLVDDGSADRTLELMRGMAEEDARLKVHTRPNGGIGAALRTGYEAAIGDHITWTPADGQIAPDAILALYARRDDALMITTVYRHRDDPWYRTVISQTLNALIKVSTGEPSKSGGNYLFAREAWERFGPKDDDSMIISAAFRANLRAANHPPLEIEIDARARHAGHSKVLNPRAILRTLKGLRRMRG